MLVYVGMLFHIENVSWYYIPQSPLIISAAMTNGKKAAVDPLTLDDVAFINRTQRSKRERKSERRNR